MPAVPPTQPSSLKRDRSQDDELELYERRVREFRAAPDSSTAPQPAFSLIPGVPDLSALQWGQPSQLGQLHLFDSNAAFMGSAGFDANFQSVALPDAGFLQNLFGNLGVPPGLQIDTNPPQE